MTNENISAIRKEIGKYVRLLKEKKGFTIKDIVEESEHVANSKKFSEATLVRSYYQDKKGVKEYSIANETLKIIADTIRAILRNETSKDKSFADAIAQNKISLNENEDFFKGKLYYKKTIIVNEIKEGRFYNWQETKRLELEAKKMLVITPNLENGKRIIHELIKHSIDNPEKISRFILTDRGGWSQREYIQEAVNIADMENEGKKLSERIKVLALYEHQLYEKSLNLDNIPTAIPIPFNVALYYNVRTPFSDEEEYLMGGSSLISEEKKEGGDYMIDEHRAKYIAAWFNAVWNALMNK